MTSEIVFDLDTIVKNIIAIPISDFLCSTNTTIKACIYSYDSNFDRTYTAVSSSLTYNVKRVNHFIGTEADLLTGGYHCTDTLTVEVLKGEELLWSYQQVDNFLAGPSIEYEVLSKLYKLLDQKFKRDILHRKESPSTISQQKSLQSRPKHFKNPFDN